MPETPDSTKPDSEIQLTKDVTPPAVPESGEVTKIVSHEVPVLEVTNPVTPGEAPVFNPAADAPAPSMPEVQEHAVQEALDEAEEGDREPVVVEGLEPSHSVQPAMDSQLAKPVKGKTDSDGNYYDPIRHKGPDVFNREGFLAKRPGGGKGGLAAKAASVRNGDSPAAQSRAVPREKVEAKQPQQNQPSAQPAPVDTGWSKDPLLVNASAEMYGNLFISFSVMLCGEEFREDDNSEKENIINTFRTYFGIRGVPPTPPEMILIVGLSGYVMKRWNRPKFQAKREDWVIKMKQKLAGH